MLSQFDEQVFNSKDLSGKGYFSSYYFVDNGRNETEDIGYDVHYSAVVFVNATSQDAVGAFGAYMH